MDNINNPEQNTWDAVTSLVTAHLSEDMDAYMTTLMDYLVGECDIEGQPTEAELSGVMLRFVSLVMTMSAGVCTFIKGKSEEVGCDPSEVWRTLLLADAVTGQRPGVNDDGEDEIIRLLEEVLRETDLDD